MLEYFYCYDFLNTDKIRLVKVDTTSNEAVIEKEIPLMPIDRVQKLVMEKGVLLLGPWCVSTKNRLKLIKYYEKSANQTRVRIYKNSHKNTFSFVQGGLVVGYMDDGFRHFNNCKQLIRESGRRKVIQTGVKNVHAFIEGDVCKITKTKYWTPITYNVATGFTAKGKSINFDGRTVKIDRGKIYISV